MTDIVGAPGRMEPASAASGAGAEPPVGGREGLTERVATLELALGGALQRLVRLEDGGPCGGGGGGGAGAERGARGGRAAGGERAGEAAGGEAPEDPTRPFGSLQDFSARWRATAVQLEAEWRARSAEAAAQLEARRSEQLRRQVELDAEREALDAEEEALEAQEGLVPECIAVPTFVHAPAARRKLKRPRRRAPKAAAPPPVRPFRAAFAVTRAQLERCRATRACGDQPLRYVGASGAPFRDTPSAAARLQKFRAAEKQRRARALAPTDARPASATVTNHAPTVPSRSSRPRKAAAGASKSKRRASCAERAAREQAGCAAASTASASDACEARYQAALELFERSKAIAKENEATAARLQKVAMDFAVKRAGSSVGQAASTASAAAAAAEAAVATAAEEDPWRAV